MHLNYLPVKKPAPFIKPTFVLVQRQTKPQKQTSNIQFNSNMRKQLYQPHHIASTSKSSVFKYKKGKRNMRAPIQSL